MHIFAFIFESIGTQELILIGIVALVILGPRKLPELARKAGKIMSEFRATTNEFKTTWEREVNFEEETRVLRESLDDPDDVEIISDKKAIDAPSVKEIDADRFEKMKGEPLIELGGEETSEVEAEEAADEKSTTKSEKRNWL